MSEANKAIAQRLIEEAWNAGNLDVLEELVAQDHVEHDPAQAGSPGGRAGMRGFIEQYKSAFPGFAHRDRGHDRRGRPGRLGMLGQLGAIPAPAGATA